MKRILAYKAKVELLAGGHFWPRAIWGPKLAWTGPFGLFGPENGIPRLAEAIQTGFGPQYRKKQPKLAPLQPRWRGACPDGGLRTGYKIDTAMCKWALPVCQWLVWC